MHHHTQRSMLSRSMLVLSCDFLQDPVMPILALTTGMGELSNSLNAPCRENGWVDLLGIVAGAHGPERLRSICRMSVEISSQLGRVVSTGASVTSHR